MSAHTPQHSSHSKLTYHTTAHPTPLPLPSKQLTLTLPLLVLTNPLFSSDLSPSSITTTLSISHPVHHSTWFSPLVLACTRPPLAVCLFRAPGLLLSSALAALVARLCALASTLPSLPSDHSHQPPQPTTATTAAGQRQRVRRTTRLRRRSPSHPACTATACWTALAAALSAAPSASMCRALLRPLIDRQTRRLCSVCATVCHCPLPLRCSAAVNCQSRLHPRPV